MNEYRSLLLLAYALHAMPTRWATYRGLKRVLGFNHARNVRALVMRAQEKGYVRLRRARFRPGGPLRTLVTPTPAVHYLVATLYRQEPRHGLH